MTIQKTVGKTVKKQKFFFYQSIKRKRLLLTPVLLVAILSSPTAFALTDISQSYSSSQQLAVGSIVSLVKNTSDQVDAALSTNVNSIVGVVVNSNNSLLSLSTGQTGQVQVATSGIEEVLVSNINGNIYQGNEVTASPISGVGMLATSDIKVVGIAQGTLNNTNGTTETYSNKSGQKHTILVGEIPVLVNVSYYYKLPDKTLIPSAIQNIADSLAGKQVNTAPILISMAIFIITIIVVASIVYSMIRSSIISVGRNPLSQSAVFRGIIQLSGLVVGILVVAVILIYMILTKL